MYLSSNFQLRMHAAMHYTPFDSALWLGAKTKPIISVYNYKAHWGALDTHIAHVRMYDRVIKKWKTAFIGNSERVWPVRFKVRNTNGHNVCFSALNDIREYIYSHICRIEYKYLLLCNRCAYRYLRYRIYLMLVEIKRCRIDVSGFAAAKMYIQALNVDTQRETSWKYSVKQLEIFGNCALKSQTFWSHMISVERVRDMEIHWPGHFGVKSGMISGSYLPQLLSSPNRPCSSLS